MPSSQFLEDLVCAEIRRIVTGAGQPGAAVSRALLCVQGPRMVLNPRIRTKNDLYSALYAALESPGDVETPGPQGPQSPPPTNLRLCELFAVFESRPVQMLLGDDRFTKVAVSLVVRDLIILVLVILVVFNT